MAATKDIREEDIQIEILIEEIEKRAPLYRKDLKEYSDVIIKKRLWVEVCENLFPTQWDKLSEQQQIKTGNDVQKRWKNVRTCFSRELRAQKCTKSGQAAVKKRKYMYFDQLLFLVPHMDNRATDSNAPPVQEEKDIEFEIENEDLKIKETVEKPSRPKKKVSYEESLLQILKEKKKVEDVDEDTHFALSLVPMLKKLSTDEKLDARIQILQVFKSVKQSYSQALNAEVTYTHVLQPISVPSRSSTSNDLHEIFV